MESGSIEHGLPRRVSVRDMTQKPRYRSEYVPLLHSLVIITRRADKSHIIRLTKQHRCYRVQFDFMVIIRVEGVGGWGWNELTAHYTGYQKTIPFLLTTCS